MPSRSEGWGGLFEDEQYRLNKERFAGICKEPLRGTLNRPPRLRLRRSLPSLLRRGMAQNYSLPVTELLKPLPDVALPLSAKTDLWAIVVYDRAYSFFTAIPAFQTPTILSAL